MFKYRYFLSNISIKTLFKIQFQKSSNYTFERARLRHEVLAVYASPQMLPNSILATNVKTSNGFKFSFARLFSIPCRGLCSQNLVEGLVRNISSSLTCDAISTLTSPPSDFELCYHAPRGVCNFHRLLVSIP